MKKCARKLAAIALAILCLLALPASADTKLSASELETLMIPYALYPDSVLGNVLIAAARPDELEAANAWLPQHKGLAPDQLMKACETEPWDASVKALLLTPDTLVQMCKNIDNTHKLGTAFVNQSADVMDSVQVLRKKAISADTLKSSKDVTVNIDDKGCVVIGTANPNVVAVPQNVTAATYGISSASSAVASAQSTGTATSASAQTTASTTAPAQGNSTVSSSSSNSSDSTVAAVVFGCCALANIAYNCSVVDWYQHQYWYGPGYNHCYYYNNAFRAWNATCYVPPALAAPVPPPPARPAYSAGYNTWAANRAAFTRSTAVGTITPNGAAVTNVHATPFGPEATTVRATPAGVSATRREFPEGFMREDAFRGGGFRRRR